MDFKEVEVARQKYSEKYQATSRKRKKYVAIVFGIVLVIDLAILMFLISQNYFSVFAGDLTSSIMIIIPAFMIVLLELVFIIVMVYICTGGDNVTEEYQAYRHAYKRYFITRQLASVFTDLNYNHELGLNKKLLDDTGLINTGDFYQSNDFVCGKYKKVLFKQADVQIDEIHEEKDEDGNTETTTVTIFRGRYLIFSFPKKFEYKMVISFNGYNGLYLNPKTGRGLNRIETESTEFNKRFLVYAEDGFEAFYILNPVFIENLDKLGQQFDNKLELYFSDNNLYVGLNDGGDAFEPPDPNVPINEREETAKVTKEMSLIVKLIDDLDLDKK